MAQRVVVVRGSGRSGGVKWLLNLVLGLALAGALITAAGGGHFHLHLPASVTAARGGTPPAGPKAPAPATSAQVTEAISYARTQLGKPYVWGGPTQPGTSYGFDCSGLTQAAWAHAGVMIERTSEQQWKSLPHITRKHLKAGDLVFYHGYLDTADNEQPPGHVALYIGDGLMIEAYGLGVPVRITPLRPGAWGYAQVTTTTST
jgi:cell wall-associated NlpC family hydrolase